MNLVVTVCTGHRRAALLEHCAADTLPCLRSAFRASRKAVLVSTGCVGACAQAPVMALSQGRTGRSGLELLHTCWLGSGRPRAGRRAVRMARRATARPVAGRDHRCGLQGCTDLSRSAIAGHR